MQEGHHQHLQRRLVLHADFLQKHLFRGYNFGMTQLIHLEMDQYRQMEKVYQNGLTKQETDTMQPRLLQEPITYRVNQSRSMVLLTIQQRIRQILPTKVFLSFLVRVKLPTMDILLERLILVDKWVWKIQLHLLDGVFLVQTEHGLPK